ncbi:MAG: methionine--tRNA ligase subunit beta [Patescibacteria group bacterium]
MITFDDFKKVELRVGEIISAVPVEGSEKLLLLKVDFGEETHRTVVSGISQYVEIEKFVGTQKIFVTNLEPRAIMGIESQAMILAGKDDTTLGLATLDRPIKNGTMLS